MEIASGRASLFKYLAGDELTRSQLTAFHLEALGSEVGKLHRLGGQAFRGQRDNPYSAEVVQGWLQGLERSEIWRGGGGAAHSAGLRSAMPKRGFKENFLPRGPIHADIFLDNVKWLDNRVSAIFDFEMACIDAFALDVAITLNAWCFDGDYSEELGRAFIRGYQQERRLETGEREGWTSPRFGAVRYTASRIRDFHLSTLPPSRLFRKDFRTYLARVSRLRSLGAEGFGTMLGVSR